jgi:hypothetical protein
MLDILPIAYVAEHGRWWTSMSNLHVETPAAICLGDQNQSYHTDAKGLISLIR